MKSMVPVALLVVAAFANASVVPTSKGTFQITKKKADLESATPAALAEGAKAEATAHCVSEKKVLDSLKFSQTMKFEEDKSGRERPVVVEMSVEFKCVAK